MKLYTGRVIDRMIDPGDMVQEGIKKGKKTIPESFSRGGFTLLGRRPEHNDCIYSSPPRM